MAETTVSMKVRKPAPSVSIIDIQGDLSGAAEDTLMDAYNEASTHGTRTLILNFTQLAYMNSSGIGLLVTLLIRANRQKQRLLAFGLSEHYTHILELTRLNEAISVYNGEAEALAAA